MADRVSRCRYCKCEVRRFTYQCDSPACAAKNRQRARAYHRAKGNRSKGPRWGLHSWELVAAVQRLNGELSAERARTEPAS